MWGQICACCSHEQNPTEHVQCTGLGWWESWQLTTVSANKSYVSTNDRLLVGSCHQLDNWEWHFKKSVRPELNCDNSLRSSHQTSSPLQSSAEKSSRPTLNVIVILLQYFNSNTVTFIYWFIYLMIIRRRYLFSNKTSQNIHVKSIVLQYILLLWRPLLPDEDPGRSLNPLETGWYPKKVPEPGPGCCWCRHTVTDAWWCVTAPCNDRLLFSSGPNWISWTR